MESYVRSLGAMRYQFDRYHSAGDLQQFPSTCLGYVKAGQAEVLYKGRVYAAKPGDVIYIAKGTTYYSIWNGKPDIVFYSVAFDFADPYAKQEYEFQLIHAPQLEPLFDQLYEETREDVSFAAFGRLYLILHELYALLQPRVGHPAERPVLPAIAYLEQHYTENPDIAFLAKLCGFSESRFYTLFKQATNCTPIQYKHNVLVQHALELLAETSLTVEEISQFLGFSSPAYFRRVFRSVTNQTPKALRQKNEPRAFTGSADSATSRIV